jgi:hypothetical protein
MTRKDYELIAKAISGCVSIYKYPSARTIADNIAYCLQKYNSRFDYDRFIAACGFNENEDNANG